MMMGFDVLVEEAGAVIRNPMTGQEITVTDGNFLFDGNKMHCTQKTYDRLKASIDARQLPTEAE